VCRDRSGSAPGADACPVLWPVPEPSARGLRQARNRRLAPHRKLAMEV
jgi:hypothetical protein